MTHPNARSLADDLVLPGRRAWLALAALSLGFFMALLDQSVVAVALPAIAAEFQASFSAAVWVSAVYLLGVAGPLLVTGRLGDKYGHRLLFQTGIVVFSVGALFSALAPTLGLLIGARLVQGLGAGILMPQSMAVINQVFPQDQRGRAFGVWGVVGSVAGLVGPVLGGAVVGQFGWQGAFAMHVPIGVVAVVLAGLWVPTLPTTAVRIDIVSAAAATGAVTAVVFAIQQGPELGWPAWMWVVLGAGIALGVVFIARQRGSGEGVIMPLQLFRIHNFSAAIVGIAAMGFVAASFMIPVMVWLQDVRGLSAQQAGLVVTPMAVVSMILGPAVGVLADKFSPRLLSVSGFVIMIATVAALWWAADTQASIIWFAVLIGVFGAGQTFIWATNAAAAMRDMPRQVMGAASGVYNTVRQLGSVVGVAVIGVVMEYGIRLAGGAHGVTLSFGAVMAALAVGVGASIMLRPSLTRVD